MENGQRKSNEKKHDFILTASGMGRELGQSIRHDFRFALSISVLFL